MQSASAANYQQVSAEEEYDLDSQIVPLHYLKNYSVVELEQLQRKHHADDASDLETTLHEYRWTYNWNYFKYSSARWLNLAFPLYAAPKNYVGIQQSVQTFLPNYTLPYEVANPAGVGLSALSAGFYIAAIDPEKLAVRFTLEYAQSDSYLTRIGNFFQRAWAAPGEAIFYCFNEFALTATNLLQSSMSFLGVSAMLTGSPILWWAGLTSIVLLQNPYFDGFSNDEFWHNFSFWWDKNRPWLVTQLDNPALASAALIEGVSSVILKSIAAYSVADSARQEFGYCPSSAMLAALSFYVSLIQFYPATYDSYMGDKIRAIAHLAKEKEQAQEQMQAANSTANPTQEASANPDADPYFSDQESDADLDPELDQDPHKTFKQKEEKVRNETSYAYPLCEQPGIIAPLAFQTFVGAYYGSSFGIAGAVVGAGFMFARAYFAERDRIIYKLVHEEIIKEREAQSSYCTQPANLVADTLTYGGAAAGMATGIGQGKDVVGNSPWLMAGYLVATIGVTLNNVRFALEKPRETFKSLIVSSRGFFSRASSAISSCMPRPHSDEQQGLLANESSVNQARRYMG